MSFSKTFLIPFLLLILFSCCGKERSSVYISAQQPSPQLDRQNASFFARLALACIEREYPNKPSHVINDSADVKGPVLMHPAFYGCYDWHSAVHGHWLLIRLLKTWPDLPEAEQIRKALRKNLSSDNILLEVAYFNQSNRKSFERTYGWAWLLKLAEELYNWQDADGLTWAINLQPLVATIINRYMDFLPRQDYPIRRGVHANTAFGLAFALDYANTTSNDTLKTLLIERSLYYYLNDSDCPVHWEPDGDDFLSPCLMEADLMSRVLSHREYNQWLQAFLPILMDLSSDAMLKPVQVSDRSDPKIVHLDGLNLSRAWCLKGVSRSMLDPQKDFFIAAAQEHIEASLPFVISGNYEGAHWLATFAVYSLLD